MKEQPTNHTGGPLLEQRFRQYLSAFDGKKKDFSEVEHLFDAIFHKDSLKLQITRSSSKLYPESKPRQYTPCILRWEQARH